MIFRKAVLFLATAIVTSTIAHAQLGVYGTVTVNRLSGQQSSPLAPLNADPASCVGTAAPSCKVNNSVDPLGGGGGIYYDFKTFGPIRLGADLRGTITDGKQGAQAYFRGTGTRIYSTLGGVRASFHTPWVPVKPYVQVSAGLGRSDYGLFSAGTGPNSSGGTVVHNNLQYEGFAGVDLRLLPIMDFRVVELGYGALTSFGTNSHSYPIGTISTGVVFHLPF
jgi:hypothetical protein